MKKLIKKYWSLAIPILFALLLIELWREIYVALRWLEAQ